MTAENKKLVQENEARFQNAQAAWIQSNYKDDKAWAIMWGCVYLACENMCKSKGKGIVIPHLEEKAMDATCKVMAKIKNGEVIGKLSSFCYFPVIEQLYNKNLQFEERTISYEAWQEFQYVEEEKR